MVATMSWSYDLLDEGDRELLRRLSVFTDGFTLEAATVIGSAGRDTLDRGRPSTCSTAWTGSSTPV